MLIKLGNNNPQENGVPINGPALTSMHVRDDLKSDGSHLVGYIIGSDAVAVKDHLFDHPGLVTHLPGNEVLLSVIRSYQDHGTGSPGWVSVEAQERDPDEAEDLERFLSEFWHCPRGEPEDLEDTHYTYSGPPGFGPTEAGA